MHSFRLYNACCVRRVAFLACICRHTTGTCVTCGEVKLQLQVSVLHGPGLRQSLVHTMYAKLPDPWSFWRFSSRCLGSPLLSPRVTDTRFPGFLGTWIQVVKLCNRHFAHKASPSPRAMLLMESPPALQVITVKLLSRDEWKILHIPHTIID